MMRCLELHVAVYVYSAYSLQNAVHCTCSCKAIQRPCFKYLNRYVMHLGKKFEGGKGNLFMR